MRGRVTFILFGLASVATVMTALERPGAEAENLPFRMVVPGIAVDAGNASPSAVRAGHVSLRNDAGLVVTGDVTNGTSTIVSAVRLKVTVVVDGTTITRETTALIDSLAPLGVSPFRVIFPVQGAVSGPAVIEVLGFEVESTAAPSASFAFAGPYPFQIGPPDPKTGVIPYSKTLEQLKGTVTNTSGATMTDVGMIIAIYDGSGSVAWVGVGADLQVPFPVVGQVQQLPAGQSGTFIVGLPIGLLNSIEGHSTIVGFINATLN